MIEATPRDSRMIKMIIEIANWLNVRDYRAQTEEATAKIVKKQSRGSVSAQNGWYMTAKQLREKSREADDAMREIKVLVEKAS